jgi:hypothetical protein
MRTLVIGLTAMTVVLAGCGVRPTTSDEHLVEIAKGHVRANLRDPSSVEFRNMQVKRLPQADNTTEVVVCGEFNAKNGFGGYAGFTPFNQGNRLGPDGKVAAEFVALTTKDGGFAHWQAKCS